MLDNIVLNIDNNSKYFSNSTGFNNILPHYKCKNITISTQYTQEYRMKVYDRYRNEILNYNDGNDMYISSVMLYFSQPYSGNININYDSVTELFSTNYSNIFLIKPKKLRFYTKSYFQYDNENININGYQYANGSFNNLYPKCKHISNIYFDGNNIYLNEYKVLSSIQYIEISTLPIFALFDIEYSDYIGILNRGVVNV